MNRLLFCSVEDGLNVLISDYVASEVCEGEYADYLAENIPSYFDKSVPLPIVKMAIQAFRAWDYSRQQEPENMFGGIQMRAEVHMIETEHGSKNEFQDYCFANGTFVPEGTRIGIQNEDKTLILDTGIFFALEGRKA